MNQRSARGARTEDLALRWLQRKGLVLVAQNYRCRWGELDLIMLESATLVIVEVRSRRHSRYLNPALSIDWRKQGKIIRSTEHYLRRHRCYRDHAVRFDVVSVTGVADEQLDWIQNAFEPENQS